MGQQHARIACLRIIQDRLRFSVLYGSSILHDQHPVCHRTDDANVVRNKHNGGSIGLAQQREQDVHG